MPKPRQITLMVLLALASLALAACGPVGSSASGPEVTARAFVDAVNARDRDKFVGLWPPDKRDLASGQYDFYTTFERKIPTIKSVVARDFRGNPTIKEVTAEVIEESLVGKRDKTLVLGIIQQDSHWYVFSVNYRDQ